MSFQNRPARATALREPPSAGSRPDDQATTVSGAYRVANAGGPRRYETTSIEAVQSGGRLLDDDGDEGPTRHLELEAAPSSHGRKAPPSGRLSSTSLDVSGIRRVSGASHDAPAPPASRCSSASHAVVDREAVVARFAGFGDAPHSLADAPAYALHVIGRRRALLRDLEHARKLRPHDVPLYEAALRSADASAVRRGIAVAASTAAVVGLTIALVVEVLLPTVSGP